MTEQQDILGRTSGPAAHLAPVRSAPNSIQKPILLPEPPPAQRHSRLDAIQDWDARVFQAQFRFKDLAALCKISERHLRRYIELRWKRRPHDWIDDIRFARARLLISKGVPIRLVAAETGFAHPADFSRAYKRRFGVSAHSSRTSI